MAKLNYFATATLTLLLALALALPAAAQIASPQSAQPQTQVPQPDNGGVNWKGIGVGAGTVAGNLLYIPAKLAYGILGGIAGGAGYALTGGNQQVANTIWRSSLGGDYVLTPDMVKGKQPIYFSGPNKTAAPQAGIQPIKPLNNATASANPAPSSFNNVPLNSTPPSSNGGAARGNNSGRPLDSGAGPANGNSSVPLPSTSIE
ncbi:MAG: hypothetical protein ACREQ4_07695 [Candidatus Binataceae bacterium]